MVTLGYVVDDSHRVLIEEKKPVGELRNPSFPGSVGHDEEWSWNVEVWNVGEVAGDFRVRLTGDLIDETMIFTVEPGSWVTLWGFTVTGPANFQLHLELMGWVLGDSYHHVVGSTLAAKARADVTASSEVAVEVGESVEGVDFPDAELRNPNYPSQVGPDEEWEGTIDAWNSGGKRGWFLGMLAENGMVVWQDREPYPLLAGTHTWYWMRRTGPLDFTWYIYFAEWTEHDSLVVSVPQRTSPPGELRNLSIPKFGVGSSEGWDSSVEAWNVGVAAETFRLVITGDIEATSESFELGPGEHTLVTFSSTGITPNGFTATLQRMVGEVWVDDDSKAEVVGERITGYIKVMGYVDVPPSYWTQDPKAKVTLDGEPVLETSSLEWEPIQVASGRTYSLDITSRGYLYWVGMSATWNEHRYRSYGHTLRGWFPVA